MKLKERLMEFMDKHRTITIYTGAYTLSGTILSVDEDFIYFVDQRGTSSMVTIANINKVDF
jgi:hypothetical protein